MLVGILAKRRESAPLPELQAIFAAHKDRVFSVALACLDGDRATAEDITQEVFVRFAARRSAFRGEARLTTYLHRITVNLCIDERRRQRRRHVPPPATATADPIPELVHRRALHEALERLPQVLREPLLLRYFDERSYDEIGVLLGCPAGTVASRLHRGLKALEKELGEVV